MDIISSIRPGPKARPFPSPTTRYRISPEPMSEDCVRLAHGNAHSAHAVHRYFDHAIAASPRNSRLHAIQAPRSAATRGFNGRFSFSGAQRRDRISYPFAREPLQRGLKGQSGYQSASGSGLN